MKDKPAKKVKGLLSDFRQFAVKGNMVDMAVAVIIGGAFGSIVNSLVNNILMPLLGVLTGGINFTSLSITLSSATEDAPIVLAYGLFIQNIINFLIISFSVFMFVKIITWLRSLPQKPEAVPSEPTPDPAEDIQLLTEIRDLLKERHN